MVGRQHRQVGKNRLGCRRMMSMEGRSQPSTKSSLLVRMVLDSQCVLVSMCASSPLKDDVCYVCWMTCSSWARSILFAILQKDAACLPYFMSQYYSLGYIPGYSLVTNFFPGQILVWFLTIFGRFTHFKINMTISRKNMPLHVFIFESWWICPGISALFPGISAFFPGISAQKNRHIFTQSRVRSAQKARNPKLTAIIWQ